MNESVFPGFQVTEIDSAKKLSDKGERPPFSFSSPEGHEIYIKWIE